MAAIAPTKMRPQYFRPDEGYHRLCFGFFRCERRATIPAEGTTSRLAADAPVLAWIICCRIGPNWRWVGAHRRTAAGTIRWRAWPPWCLAASGPGTEKRPGTLPRH